MDVTIDGEEIQNLDICSALRAFEQSVILIEPYLLWPRGLGLYGLIRWTVLLSRHLRQAKGTEDLF